MRARGWMRICGLGALWACAVSAGAALEMRGGDRSEACASGLYRWRAAVLDCSSGKFVREIDDAASGSQWLLFRNRAHPGGPGKLVLRPGPGDADQRQACRYEAVQRRARDVVKSRKMVIRSGDRLVVQERNSSTVLALEGTALSPAAEGEALNVRLRIGGSVRAIAVLPGLARLAALREAQR